MKRIFGLILVLFILINTLPVAAQDSAQIKVPPGYQVEEYYRQLKVDISTTKGRLIKNWELFIKMNYKGWKVEQQPLIDQYGRYFVVLGRWSVKLVPIIVAPTLQEMCKTKTPPPNCPMEVN